MKEKGMEVLLLSEEHLKDRVKWINDSSINKTLSFDYPTSLSKTKKWFNSIVMDSSKINFTIVKDNINIGMTGLINIDYKSRKAEFYITIGEEKYRGKGLSSSIINEILNYAFITLNLNKVYLNTFDYNVIAIKTYVKNGFNKEGISRNHCWKDGEYQDVIFYSILKEEWMMLNE